MSILSNSSSDEDETLEDVLRNRLVESAFEKTPRSFLPREALNQVVTRTAIIGALEINIPSEEDDKLISFILSDARKVFATTVFVGVRPLRRAMQMFQANKFDDKILPLRETVDTSHGLHPFEVMESTSVGSRKRLWTRARIMKFHDHQWKFLTHVFSVPGHSRRSDIDDFGEQALGEQTLPFVKRINDVREGSFGSLIPYMIHPDHLDHASDSTRLNVIAVKRFSLDTDCQQTSIQQWRTESKAAAAMNYLNQDHIVRFVTAFRRLESSCLVEHYLVSEWADGGDLNDMWAAIPQPVFNSRLLSAFMRQLLGVAKALAATHNNQREGMFHGSLRPSRIFWFRRGDEFGMLKIGGWGKVPSNITFSDPQQLPEVSLGPTAYLDRRYSSPEMSAVGLRSFAKPGYFRNNEELRSLQANDMWALGCIAFECMIWLLEGSNEIRRFRRQSSTFSDSGSPFYQVKPISGHYVAEVHTVVTQRLDEMAQSKAYPVGHSSPGNLLDIIRRDLLVAEDQYQCLAAGHANITWQAHPPKRLDAEKLVLKLQSLNTSTESGSDESLSIRTDSFSSPNSNTCSGEALVSV